MEKKPVQFVINIIAPRVVLLTPSISTDMKTKMKAHTSPTREELSGYIDIVPYQQKGDPCYGGDTGETEYENYVKGTPELYQERERENRLSSPK